MTSEYLRTEVYTAVGGEISIVGEHTQAYFIREDQLIVFVIGDEVISRWSGWPIGSLSAESLPILEEHTYGAHTTTDINGDTIIYRLTQYILNKSKQRIDAMIDTKISVSYKKLKLPPIYSV